VSQAAVLEHPGVEPAESPLTPESWGKLGMWIFLAGDAMSSAPARRLRRAPLQQRRLADAVARPRHPAHRVHDVPPRLQQRHDGEGLSAIQHGDQAGLRASSG